jgi:hypothetical protein
MKRFTTGRDLAESGISEKSHNRQCGYSNSFAKIYFGRSRRLFKTGFLVCSKPDNPLKAESS